MNAEKPRDQLTACRIVLTASLLNLRYRQLPQPLPVRHQIPKATRKEYEEMLNADQLYLNYLHDWQVCLAGYPPGHTLKYLEFPRISGVTPQTLRDPSRVQPKVFPEDKYQTWDDCDLWPIKKEYRAPLTNTLLRLVTLKDNLPVSLGAARTMLTASSSTASTSSSSATWRCPKTATRRARPSCGPTRRCGSPAKTVCWDRLSKYITKNKLVVEDGW